MPLPIAAVAGAAARGAGGAATRTGAASARGVSAREAGYQLELAKKRQSETMPDEEQDEEPDITGEPTPSVADGAGGAAEAAIGMGVGYGSYAILRLIWIDISFMLGLGSLFLSWVALFCYTIFIDLITVFGFQKPKGFMANFMDPVDGAMIFLSKEVIDKLPDWLKSGPRLLGRVMIIYPFGVLVASIYFSILVLIIIVAYTFAHPVDAAIQFGPAIVDLIL